ncbi:follistatin-like isoform X2 [Amphiura filiformis]|uniref:follistatin-like isoform X2 n=1 Tax=Amphiura filiformis TaxID=82378 RepID=UPI003B2221AC
MKVYVVFLVLGLCVLLATAKPSGKKGGHDGGAGGHGRHGEGDKKPNKQGRGQTPVFDPVCENLACEKPSRETYVCGTDGQTYRSECFLMKERCKGKITADVKVASPGPCKGADGKPLKPNGHRKSSEKKCKKLRKHAKKLPKECLHATMEDVTGEIPVCTASCPANTTEYPLQQVCGSDGRTYESDCVLEFIACITNTMDLAVASEGACLFNAS